ncbi:MAG: hypothetical protein WAU46_08295 [Methanoregula sp.]|uniref:hypothetical protein n=1 Tax=Methanoregula sp. TaxID=2052170 RepID=UPI003BAE7F6F
MVEPIILKRLVFIKYLYTVAIQQSQQPEPLSSASILTFHDSIELFLELASEVNGVSKTNIHFLEYWELLKSKLPNEGLTQKMSMRRLNNARVSLKHHGTLPSKLNIEGFRVNSTNFFQENTPIVFGINFDKLSFSELIKDKKLQKLAIRAENACEKGNFTLCLKLCDKIIAEAVFNVGDIFTKAGMLTIYLGGSKEFKAVIGREYPNKYKGEKFHKPLKEISRAILQLGMSSTGMQFLGEYRMDFLKFRQKFEKLDKLSDIEIEEAAKMSLNFVTNLILKWQGDGIL